MICIKIRKDLLAEVRFVHSKLFESLASSPDREMGSLVINLLSLCIELLPPDQLLVSCIPTREQDTIYLIKFGQLTLYRVPVNDGHYPSSSAL